MPAEGDAKEWFNCWSGGNSWVEPPRRGSFFIGDVGLPEFFTSEASSMAGSAEILMRLDMAPLDICKDAYVAEKNEMSNHSCKERNGKKK